ncbi:succinate dehydrogenase subunit 4, putative [Hepatocystis sp. ex Piliocolobus tephrosceles]|nr:succinate dehydrogenase subunit 4, putative [Hepatocystis sp. ex Piliocolobus tephrosceles]
MKIKINLGKRKRGFEISIIEGFKSLMNKIFGQGIHKYFKFVNVAIIILFVIIMNYILKFDPKTARKNKNLLYMYYGFLLCLIGFAISVNWVHYDYIKNKKKKSPMDIKCN